MAQARITFHYDGPIAENHQLSLRVLAQTLNHLQSAIDRAYLDDKYGNVWKYARLKSTDYAETDFIVGTPRDGGYILDLMREGAENIAQRIHSAISDVIAAPWDEGADEAAGLLKQSQRRAVQLNAGVFPGRTIQDYILAQEMGNMRRYGVRAISKEIDQILANIRRDSEGDEENTLELEFGFGHKTVSHHFDQDDAHAFHQKISLRELGEPLRYEGVLRSIDRGKLDQKIKQPPKAKLTLQSGRDVMLHLGTEAAYDELAPFMTGNQVIAIFASPLLEFNSFDPNSGDLYYVMRAAV